MRKNKSFRNDRTISLTSEVSRNLYSALLRCRRFEEKIVELYPEQEIRCPTHLSLGQEAVAAGVCGALRVDDLIFSTHRCHSHTIAKGGDFKLMMAELYGKATGCSRGKGGSMHFVQPEIGAMGASAIVGGTVPLTVGAALAAKRSGKDNVSVAFFGDGGIEQGTFHECMNFASLKKLPVLFICENNSLATCSFISARQPHDEIYKRAQSYLIPGVQVDGTRVEEVYAATQKALVRARKGQGPTLIEARCYRWKEHVGPNFDYDLGYRTKEELDRWMKKDPVKLFERYLLKEKFLHEKDLTEISGAVERDLNDSVAFAKESPFPKPEELYENV